LILRDVLIVMLFGFPAALLSLLLSAIGVFKQKFWLVMIGAVLFIPFSYYLSGSPGLAGLPILLPGFQVGSAIAVRERNQVWAWLLLAPPLFAVLWLAGVVLVYT
jgi:hypothetical protein